MNYYYTKFEEKKQLGSGYANEGGKVYYGAKPQKSRLPLAEHLLSISRYKILA